MLDFLLVSAKSPKKDILEITPKFKVKKSKDLMIRGRDFYAIWDERTGLWSTDEEVAINLIDAELEAFAEEKRKTYDGTVIVKYLWDSESGSIDKWHKYVQKHMRDNFTPLDETIVFADTKTKRTDYASKKLNYSMMEGDISAWDELVGTLYSKKEREKIEWAIGAIIKGAAKDIQKFMVLYGEGGTGKSTIINVFEKLFAGYWTVFDAKALGSNNAAFALECFKTNPLVAIQHDGDLSRIEDNTKLNSIVAHETMLVNEKFKSTYPSKFNAFLIMGTNRPVNITDAKSGIIRRLIDVTPTGNKLTRKRYNHVVSQVNFELGAIAHHCLGVFEADPGRYDDYIPVNMLGYSNDFYNFITDSYEKFNSSPGIDLDTAYEMYLLYCDESKITFPLKKRLFKSELGNYYEVYYDRYTLPDGTTLNGYYETFLKDKFTIKPVEKTEAEPLIVLRKQHSKFEEEYGDCFAQYSNIKESPKLPWDQVTSKLSDLDTSKLHYVRLPLNQIVIDFDLKNEAGEKDFDLNLRAASKWPKTYAEVSKGGKGIHLHYIYPGDPEKLIRVHSPDIEVKVFTGKSALRRKLTLCNDEKVRQITSGLEVKGDKDVINIKGVQSEMHLRNLIKRNMEKEFHPGTKPSMDFIYKLLNDAYEAGLKYDVTDMRPAVLAFAMKSTNQKKYCVDLFSKMPFKSEENAEAEISTEEVITFFDVEVFPNLFVVVTKMMDKPCIRYINPDKSVISGIIKKKLVGFNNRRYDNHILYGAWMGYSNLQLYNLSQRIVNGSRNAFFGNAYDISYTDIYDFSAKKQSLKKFEIELGIHHQELGLKWDEEVPEDKWNLVAEYCENDVIATEAVFKARYSDFQARLILADVAGMSPNDTTNSLTTRIIFGDDRNPQQWFNYRDLSQPVRWTPNLDYDYGEDYEYHIFDALGQPTYKVYKRGEELPEGYSVLPFFPGYTFEAGKSVYLGDEVGEGGRVYAEPGMYEDIALIDVASMHPHSIIAERLFGVNYTKRFKEIVDGRLYVKHKDYDSAKKMLNGAFERHLSSDEGAEGLAQALKIAINSVYGLTKASFDHPFRDPRNKDNIVAKRGALFMTNLKEEVQKRGFTVAHIKTDSIKIPGATPEIIDFCMKYAAEFGYTFEHEATYDRMCLVNDAVYVALYMDANTCADRLGYIPSDNAKYSGEWSATGKQFQIPYVFKTLFSHEPLEFKDLCVTNAVTTALYLDLNEDMYMGLLDHYGIDPYDVDGCVDDDYIYAQLRSLKMKKADVKAILDDPTMHKRQFIGRVGSFCPIMKGYGGGLLLREKDGKFSNATGAKGYRWLEDENVKKLGLTDCIDMTYFNVLVTDAIDAISEFGDFEWFTLGD